jgi:type II secretion system protein C
MSKGESELARAQLEQTNRRRARFGRWLAISGCATLVFMATWIFGLRPRMSMGHWKPMNQTAAAYSSVGAGRVPVHSGLTQPVDPTIAFPSIKSSASEMPRKLLLTGTLPGRNSREGSAFIGVDARNPQTYSAGALLVNGVRLKEIFKDRVVLEKGGRSAILYLQGRQGPLDLSGVGDLVTVGGPMSVGSPARLRHEVFTDYVRPSPVYEGAALLGFQVYPGRQGAVFARWGLQGGDVITAFDGESVTDTGQGMEQFRQLASGLTMRVTVMRKGQSLEIPLDGSLIAVAEERDQSAAIAPLRSP